MPQVDLPLEELTEYRGSSPCPVDFDQYWQRALTELHRMEAHGFSAQWEPAAFSIPALGVRCMDLYFTGTMGARIHARVVLPGLQPDGQPHQGLLKFHGYTMNAGEWASLLPLAAGGCVVAAMDVRGQGGESTDPGGAGGNTHRGHIIRGVEGAPEDLFYRHVFMDTAILARIILAHNEVDPRQVATFGASQGGALALACAALEPRISRVLGIYPFLSDYRRVWEMEGGDSAYEELRYYLKRRDPRHQRIDQFFLRLGYIDVVNLARWITVPVTMVTGLMDSRCPPSTQFALYNNLAGPRQHILYPDFGHETLPDMQDIILQWALEGNAELK